MNLNIDVCCEITDFLISEKLKFANVICKQAAMSVLRQIIWTNRENVVQEQQKKQALLELKGISESNFYGLESEYKRDLEAIDIDFSNLNSPCFRKKNAGIKAGSM
jgi:hypothetical protein